MGHLPMCVCLPAQSAFSLRARQALLKFAHCAGEVPHNWLKQVSPDHTQPRETDVFAGAFIWLLPYISCNTGFAFALMTISTFCWGE